MHRWAGFASQSLPVLVLLLITLASLYATVHADSLPDLAIGSMWLEDAVQPDEPITELSPGQSFNIVATVTNLGQETAFGFYLDVYYDSDYGRGGPDDIAAGETQTWYVGPLIAQEGTHTTTWIADPDNLIAELDEGNNQMQYMFTIGQQNTTTTTSTSTVETTLVVASTSSATVTGYTTTTVTSYTDTFISTSTIVVPVTVTVGPSVVTTTVETTATLTSTGTATVTGYTTMTVTSYTGTSTSTSTIVVPTTVTAGQLAASETVQATQTVTSSGTATVTGYTTSTVTSYTSTATSTSTTVVYTTVTESGVGLAASIPLTYLGFLSLFALTVGRKTTAEKNGGIPGISSWISERRCSSN